MLMQLFGPVETLIKDKSFIVARELCRQQTLADFFPFALPRGRIEAAAQRGRGLRDRRVQPRAAASRPRDRRRPCCTLGSLFSCLLKSGPDLDLWTTNSLQPRS